MPQSTGKAAERLTRRQFKSIWLLGLNPDKLSPKALKAFFDWSDRGILPGWHPDWDRKAQGDWWSLKISWSIMHGAVMSYSDIADTLAVLKHMKAHAKLLSLKMAERSGK